VALGEIVGLGKGDKINWVEGIWTLDEDDFLVLALLMDPVYAAELCFYDPANKAYAGCYRVRDYQYPLFRIEDLYAGAACARSTGKTESIKARAFSHAFRRIMENLLITAPELIHLLPLTDAVEDRIRDTRLTREFLDTRGGQTGFTHKPFGVNFLDGTKIVGRIPRLTGTGVKGQHQPDLIIEEAQDYPEKGWIEVHETVEKDHIDADGEPDFTYHFYGVHSGARDSGFYKRTTEGGFRQVTVTALQRPGWGAAEKQAAKAAYGGTSSPDYRRNILGEAGAAASPMFVTSRLIACVDQDRETPYNQHEYVHQLLRVEEVDEMIQDMWSEEERAQPHFNPMPDILDLPPKFSVVYGGADLGLTISPTVISIFSHETVDRTPRFKLLRRYTLERFRTKQLRQVMYALGYHFGRRLEGFGIDVTGLGFPIFQEMQDDENAPQHLLNVTRGYFFNAKVPVNVDPEFVSQDANGKLRDQYGSEVKLIEDPYTNEKRYVTMMPMIAASTRYLRDDFVDTGFLLLPFDPEIVTDMQGETAQRVMKVGEMTGRRKPNAFHILDSFRAMAMVFRSGEIEEQMEIKPPAPVLDTAMDLADPMGMT
jgi:hypothetical protein